MSMAHIAHLYVPVHVYIITKINMLFVYKNSRYTHSLENTKTRNYYSCESTSSQKVVCMSIDTPSDVSSETIQSIAVLLLHGYIH